MITYYADYLRVLFFFALCCVLQLQLMVMVHYHPGNSCHKCLWKGVSI